MLHVDGRDGAIYASHKRTTPGQRRRIAGSTPEALALVEAWMEAVVLKLERLEESCALDVADRGETTCERVGELLGTTKQFVSVTEDEALKKLAATPETAEAFASVLAQKERVALAEVDDRRDEGRRRITPVRSVEPIDELAGMASDGYGFTRFAGWRQSRRNRTQPSTSTKGHTTMLSIRELSLNSERQRHVAELICGHNDRRTLAAEVAVRVALWASGPLPNRGKGPNEHDPDHICTAWNTHGLHHSELNIYGLELRTVATQLEDLATQLRGQGLMRACDEAVADQLSRFDVMPESSSPVHMLAAAEKLYGTPIERPRGPGDGSMVVRRVAGTGLPSALERYLKGWRNEQGADRLRIPSEADARDALAAMRAEPPLTAEQRAEVMAEIRASLQAAHEAKQRREAAAVELGRMRRDLRAIVAGAIGALEGSDPADVTRAWLACREAMAAALADAGVDVELPELEQEEAAAAAS